MTSLETETLQIPTNRRKVIEASRQMDEAAMFRDLLENARRRGASEVNIVLKETSDIVLITVEDNGSGIDSVATLFNICDGNGAPASDETNESGEPGFFKAADLGLHIRSSAVGDTPSYQTGVTSPHIDSGWSIEKKTDDLEEGVVFSFVLAGSELAVRTAFERAARHFPGRVFVDGDLLAHLSPESGMVFSKYAHGATIRVISSRVSEVFGFGRFNSVRFDIDLPKLAMHGVDETLGVIVDIHDAPELKLSIPNRDEVKSSDFLKRLRAACERALYQAARDLGSHSLSFGDWRKAGQCGVILPAAEEALPRFLPHKDRSSSDPVERVTIDERSIDKVIVVECGLSTQDAISLARVAEIHADSVILVERNPAFVGYDWYNRLPKLSEIHWFVKNDAGETEYSDTSQRSTDVWARNIRAELSVSHAEGFTETYDYDTDLLLTGTPTHQFLEDVNPIIVKEHALTADRVSEALHNAFFLQDEFRDAEPIWRQELWFCVDVRGYVFELMESSEAGTREALRLISEQYLTGSVDENQHAIINICAGRVDVFVQASATEPTDRD